MGGLRPSREEARFLAKEILSVPAELHESAPPELRSLPLIDQLLDRTYDDDLNTRWVKDYDVAGEAERKRLAEIERYYKKQRGGEELSLLQADALQIELQRVEEERPLRHLKALLEKFAEGDIAARDPLAEMLKQSIQSLEEFKQTRPLVDTLFTHYEQANKDVQQRAMQEGLFLPQFALSKQEKAVRARLVVDEPLAETGLGQLKALQRALGRAKAIEENGGWRR